MATPVTMPMLSLTMEEGTVATWLKNEGDTIQKDEPLLTVEVDKGTLEVPSPAAGVLRRIIVQPGQTVPIKAVIGEIAAPGEADAAPTPVAAAAAAAGGPGDLTPPQSAARQAVAGTPAEPTALAAGGPLAGGPGDLTPSQMTARESSAPREGAQRVFASPRARMRARELGLDVATLSGTGPNGRVVEEDVLAHAPTAAPSAVQGRVLATPLARRLALEHDVRLTDVQGTGPGGRVTHEDVLAAAEQRQGLAGPAAARVSTPVEGVLPLSRLRRITADRMAQSAHSVARVTLFVESDLTEAARFRKQLAPEYERLGVAKLPWDAILAKAAGMALAEHGAVNARWVDGQGLVPRTKAHVGIAVALDPEGLVVPVLRDADTRSLRELAADALTLVEKARASRLSPAEMSGGTFTITNLGQYRVDGFTPIINPPETAILGVGRIAEKPAVVDGRIEARTLCTLSLSFDHRVVDGAPAAAFLARLVELLERPYALLGI